MNPSNNVGDQKGTKISIIQALRINGPVARIELTKLTGLSRATVSLAIAELIDSNLVQETETRPSTGGRPAILLELTPHANIVIGADYSNQNWTVGAFDLPGNVVREMGIPVTSNSPDLVVKALTDRLGGFIAQLPTRPVELIGLGLPGLVDVNRGIIKSASDLGWAEVDISMIVQEQFGWPSAVLNRHRARGLAECRFGAGRDFAEVIYIGVGTGIAAGLFNHRQLLFGAVGGAGELGHITIDPDGPLCPCGNNGCLQQLASGPAMEQAFRMLLRAGGRSDIYPDNRHDLQLINAEMICTGANNGDELCVKVVDQAAGFLGIAMATMVNIMNPGVIILGGAIPLSCERYVATATQVMHRRAMSPLTANVTVKTAAYHEIGGAMGAANFALDQHMSYSLFKK